MDAQSASARRPAAIGAIFAPQARLGRGGMLAVTVLGVFAGLALSRTGVRFDGLLDVHRTWRGQAVPLTTAVLDQMAAVPVAALAAALVLRLAGHRARPADVLLAVGVARAPLVLVAPTVLAMPVPSELLTAGSPALLAPSPAVVLGGLVAVTGVAWAVVLLASGLRGATGARGWRLAGLTATTVVAAEMAGKGFLAAAG